MTRRKVIAINEPGCEVRPIPGFEGLYSVAKDGRVWSHAKSMGVSRHGGKWLSPGAVDTYPNVALFKDQKQHMKEVHRLVALAWVPNPLGLPEVNHMFGDTTNPHADGLEWTTPSGNIQHAHDTGLNPSSRKLSDDQVASLKAALRAGAKQKDLARIYGVSKSTISLINSGRLKYARKPVTTE